LHSGLGQAIYICVPLSPSSIIWYRPRGWSLAGKVNTGLVESNGSLPLGLWLNVTCGLTAKKPGSAQCLTLVIEYGTTFLFCIYAIKDIRARIADAMGKTLFTDKMCSQWNWTVSKQSAQFGI